LNVLQLSRTKKLNITTCINCIPILIKMKIPKLPSHVSSIKVYFSQAEDGMLLNIQE
jgi:hypothetical protein